MSRELQAVRRHQRVDFAPRGLQLLLSVEAEGAWRKDLDWTLKRRGTMGSEALSLPGKPRGKWKSRNSVILEKEVDSVQLPRIFVSYNHQNQRETAGL